MRTYGPFQATINTPFQIGVDPATVAVQIHNQTGLSLRVYFGNSYPATSADTAHWHATISPGSHPVLPVNSNQPFSGTISLFPFSEQGAPTQTPGIISASSLVVVDAYFAGETLPQSVYSPVFQQGAAQQRVIAIPPAGKVLNNGATYAGGGSIDQTVVTGDLVQISIPSAANILTNQAPFIVCYLHALHAKFRANVGGANCEVVFSLTASQFSNLGVLKAGPVTLFTSEMSAAYTGAAPWSMFADRIDFCPHASLANIIQTGGIAAFDIIKLQYNRLVTVGNWQLFLNPVFTADLTNVSPVASYGGVNVNSVAGGNPPPTSAADPHTW